MRGALATLEGLDGSVADLMTGPGSGRQPPHTSHNLTFADTIPRIGADMVLTRVIEGLAHGKTDQGGGGRSRNRQPRRLRLGRRDQGLCPAHRAGGTKSYVLNSRAGCDRNTATRRSTIGAHSSPWTPEQARREARAPKINNMTSAARFSGAHS